MSKLLAVEETLLIFFPGAFVTTPSAQELHVLLGQILQSVGESPSGDSSSSDSMTLRAFDDFPLDGKAIDLLFLADSCLNHYVVFIY